MSACFSAQLLCCAPLSSTHLRVRALADSLDSMKHPRFSLGRSLAGGQLPSESGIYKSMVLLQPHQQAVWLGLCTTRRLCLYRACYLTIDRSRPSRGYPWCRCGCFWLGSGLPRNRLQSQARRRRMKPKITRVKAAAPVKRNDLCPEGSRCRVSDPFFSKQQIRKGHVNLTLIAPRRPL